MLNKNCSESRYVGVITTHTHTAEHAKHQMFALDLLSLCDQRLNELTEGPAVIEARQLRLLLESNDGRRCCLLA